MTNSPILVLGGAGKTGRRVATVYLAPPFDPAGQLAAARFVAQAPSAGLRRVVVRTRQSLDEPR